MTSTSFVRIGGALYLSPDGTSAKPVRVERDPSRDGAFEAALVRALGAAMRGDDALCDAVWQSLSNVTLSALEGIELLAPSALGCRGEVRLSQRSEI